MSILDHIGIPVADTERSVAFYTKALAPLGISLVMQFGEAAGFGAAQKPDFWVSKVDVVNGTVHVAFAAKGRTAVKAFHEAALAAGGKDNGAPGVREQYHPNYYAAFVTDPDGHNVEVVCHEAYLG